MIRICVHRRHDMTRGHIRKRRAVHHPNTLQAFNSPRLSFYNRTQGHGSELHDLLARVSRHVERGDETSLGTLCVTYRVMERQRSLGNSVPEISVRSDVRAGIDLADQHGGDGGVGNDFAELFVTVEDCCFVAFRNASVSKSLGGGVRVVVSRTAMTYQPSRSNSYKSTADLDNRSKQASYTQQPRAARLPQRAQ
jgi:hypothetical protein